MMMEDCWSRSAAQPVIHILGWYLHIGMSSMQSAPATARPELQQELSTLATLGWNAPTLCIFSCNCSIQSATLCLRWLSDRGAHYCSHHPPPRVVESARISLAEGTRSQEKYGVQIVFEELALTCRSDFWWRKVLGLWASMLQANSYSICSLDFHDTIALAQDGCGFGCGLRRLQVFHRP